MEQREALEKIIDRVQQMEQYFDEVSTAFHVNPESVYEDTEIRKIVQILMEYMDGGQWQQDYECDESDGLPKDLKRGVLSEDLLYNLLCQIENAEG